MAQQNNEKLNVALVGCGEISNYHMNALKKIKSLQVVAVCDTNEKLVAKKSAEWGVPHYYTNLSEMLDKEAVSIVSVLTPPNFHAPVTIEALKRGINVLSEKPFTMTTSDSALILKSSKETSAKLTVDYNWLFNRVMLKALSLVKNNELGKILLVDVKVLHPNWDPMASNKDHWCHKLPGGRFGEMLTHPVYFLQSFLGDNLTVGQVLSYKSGDYSWMPHDELHVTLQNGVCPGQIYVSFNAPRPAIEVNVYGSKKILNIDVLNQTIIEHGPRSLSKVDSFKDSLGTSYKISSSVLKNGIEYLMQQRGEFSFRYVYTSFEKSIRENIEPLVTPMMASNTVRLVEEICNHL